MVDFIAAERGGEGNDDVLEGCRPGAIDKVPDAVLLPMGEKFVAKFRHSITRDCPGDRGSGITLTHEMKQWVRRELQRATRSGALPPNPAYEDEPPDAETAALLRAAKLTRRPVV
jgi:hypothetical protein